MRYQDKAPEEIRSIIDAYRENHFRRTGRYPDTDFLASKLMELADQKEQQALYSTFEHFTPQSLNLAAKILKEPHKEPEEVVKVVKVVQEPEPTKTRGRKKGSKNLG